MKFTERMHRYFEQRDRDYFMWHRNSAHSHVHAAVFILVTFIFSGAVYAVSSTTFDASFAAVSTAPALQAEAETVESLTNDILIATKEYESASAEEKNSVADKLTKKVLKRKDLLQKEIKQNPKKFLVSALPGDLREQLPVSVQTFIEKEVSDEGTLDVVIEDDFNKASSKVLYEFKSKNGKKYNVHFTNRPENIKSGSKVKVKGVALDSEIVTTIEDEGPAKKGSSGSTSLSIVAEPDEEFVTGSRRVVVLMMNFANNTSQPWTKSQVGSVMFTDANSSNNFFKEASGGQVSLVGDVYGWFTIPYSNTGCNDKSTRDAWRNAVDQVATAAGVNLLNYDHKVYIMNSRGDCTFGGVAGVNSNWSMSAGYNNAGVYSHELGHNFGMRHADRIDCRTKQIDSYANCTIEEYGNRSDIMGNSWNSYNQLNGPHKISVGWLPQSGYQTVTTSGTYTIAPIEMNDSSIKVLKIAKPDTNENYYLTYRQPIGFDASLNASFINGVSIDAYSSGPVRTLLVDTMPGDSSTTNAPLSDGRTFTDNINGISITQLSHSATGVTVQISLNETAVCTKANPTVSLSPLSQTGSASASLKYTLSVKNQDSSACGSTTFAVSRVIPSGWTGSFSSTTLSLSPGNSGQTTFTVAPPVGVTDGTYAFTLKAADSLNSQRSASISGNYISFTNTSAPTVAITTPVNGAIITASKSQKVTATANGAGGIGKIEIFVNGNQIGSCSAKKGKSITSCSANWTVRNIAKGQYTISATATNKDAVPKNATASITVTRP